MKKFEIEALLWAIDQALYWDKISERRMDTLNEYLLADETHLPENAEWKQKQIDKFEHCKEERALYKKHIKTLKIMITKGAKD